MTFTDILVESEHQPEKALQNRRNFATNFKIRVIL